MNLDSLEAQARRAIANDHNTAVWYTLLHLISEHRALHVDYDVLVKHYAELEAERSSIVECECGLAPEIRRVS